MKIDASGVDTAKLDGTAYAEPGTYHWKVDDVVEENDKGNFEAHLSILAGQPKGMEGRTHRETFFLTPKSISRLLQFAVALKLITTEEIERCNAAGEEVDIDWTKAPGRQFCGRLSRKKNQDGSESLYCELGFAIWSIDSKAAKGVPLDAAAAKTFLASVGGKMPSPATKANAAGGNGAKKLPMDAAAQADPFSGADDLFG